MHDIYERCQNGRIKWSIHSSERLLQRGISRDDVLHVLELGEIIEEYPNHWLNPAALVFGKTTKGKTLHVVVGVDDYLHIITAYHPDQTRFDAGLKRRKE